MTTNKICFMPNKGIGVLPGGVRPRARKGGQFHFYFPSPTHIHSSEPARKIINLAGVILIIVFCLFPSKSAPGMDEFSTPDLILTLKKEYSDWQGNRIEKLVFLCRDGQVVRFAGNSTNRVSVRLADIIKALARTGNTLASVSAVVHNHKWPDDFSEEDRSLLRALRKYGFQGRFLVYYPERRIIKELTDPDS